MQRLSKWLVMAACLAATVAAPAARADDFRTARCAGWSAIRPPALHGRRARPLCAIAEAA